MVGGGRVGVQILPYEKKALLLVSRSENLILGPSSTRPSDNESGSRNKWNQPSWNNCWKQTVKDDGELTLGKQGQKGRQQQQQMERTLQAESHHLAATSNDIKTPMNQESISAYKEHEVQKSNFVNLCPFRLNPLLHKSTSSFSGSGLMRICVKGYLRPGSLCLLFLPEELEMSGLLHFTASFVKPE